MLVMGLSQRPSPSPSAVWSFRGFVSKTRWLSVINSSGNNLFGAYCLIQFIFDFTLIVNEDERLIEASSSYPDNWNPNFGNCWMDFSKHASFNLIVLNSYPVAKTCANLQNPTSPNLNASYITQCQIKLGNPISINEKVVA